MTDAVARSISSVGRWPGHEVTEVRGYTGIVDLARYPGGDLIEQGLADLSAGVESVPALLVAIGAPRLRSLGLAVAAHTIANPEHRLYAALARTAGLAAHSQYNALVRRLVSFERALACGA